MTEEWRALPSFGNYEASNLGRVRNRVTGHVLAQRKNWKGYCVVELSQNRKRRKPFVARLVCEAFHGPQPFTGAQAAHLDGSRDNNIPENLAWVSCSENNQHKVLHGTANKGERNGRALLSAEQVIAMRKRAASGASAKVLAEQFNQRITNVRLILRGQRWRHLISGSGASAQKAAPVNNAA